MKASLVILTIFIAGALPAQEKNYSDLPKNFKQPWTTFDMRRYDNLPQHQFSQTMGSAKLLSVSPNGNKIYALPQDNMPCIVPDMNQFTMPNAGKNIQIYRYPQQGAIPNPICVIQAPGSGVVIRPGIVTPGTGEPGYFRKQSR